MNLNQKLQPGFSMIPRLSLPIPDIHIQDVQHNQLEKKSLFTQILNPTIVLLRVSGLFPVHSPKRIHWKNLWSYIVIAFMLFGYSYIATYRTIISAVDIFKNWNADTTIQFAVCLWFCIAFDCLIFAIRLFWMGKLDKLNNLLQDATNFNGLRSNIISIRRNYITLFILMIGFIISVSVYCPIMLLADFAQQWPGVDSLKRMYIGDEWYWQLQWSILTALNVIIISQCGIFYWYFCHTLCIEFKQLNIDISTRTDIFLLSEWINIAKRHTLLMKSLKFLSETVSGFVFFMFCISSLTGILLSYLLLHDIHPSFRIYGIAWLIASVLLNVLYCWPADSLHTQVKKTKEVICERMLYRCTVGTNSTRSMENEQIEQIARWICDQSSLDITINALGFFTVSKAALLTTYSFIATYLVILLQTDIERRGNG